VNDPDDLALYPYVNADLERINPSQVRVGDLLAARGPVGTGRWVGDPVLTADYAGTDRYGEKYAITIRQTNWGHEISYEQPESMPLYRVRKDRIKTRTS
jgi:hypothetical protein